jgi:transglutaminase-like putative cysteine protease
LTVTWMLRIEHHTGYRYRSEVLSSYNEARMTPLTTDRQTTVDSRVEVEPAARMFRYLDYWATVVDAFDLHMPHTELAVRARSVVETNEAPQRPDGPGWDVLGSEPVLDRFSEFLAPSAYVSADAELFALATELSAGRSPGEAVEAAAGWVNSHLTYTPGATQVSTSALEAFRAGHGVCQDYTHLMLALLRVMGVPSRYASGYLHQADAQPGDVVSGESHAWVEAWLGDWWGFDPTNGVPAGQRHALVGRGRDYSDVPPLKGVYNAGTSQALDVEVRITRLA